MRRLCGRPGCSAPATVTFTFDATQRIVWLSDLADGTARAGDLCVRHADTLAPPQGWIRDDRRPVKTMAGADVASDARPVVGAEVDELLPQRQPKRRRRKTQRWSDVPSLFDTPTPLEPAPAAARTVLELVETDHSGDEVGLDAVTTDTPAWEPRFDVDDLGGLLDAKSPLLSRAFRAAKTSDDTEPAVDPPAADYLP